MEAHLCSLDLGGGKKRDTSQAHSATTFVHRCCCTAYGTVGIARYRGDGSTAAPVCSLFDCLHIRLHAACFCCCLRRPEGCYAAWETCGALCDLATQVLQSHLWDSLYGAVCMRVCCPLVRLVSVYTVCRTVSVYSLV